MYLLVSRNYKPDFEMMLEGVFTDREKAEIYKIHCEIWKQDAGIYNDEYYIIEMPIDPEPSPEEHYYNVEMYVGADFYTHAISYGSTHWLQGDTYLNKVGHIKNNSIEKYWVTVKAKTAMEATATGAVMIKKKWWNK
jgi:hypothetical protein